MARRKKGESLQGILLPAEFFLEPPRPKSAEEKLREQEERIGECKRELVAVHENYKKQAEGYWGHSWSREAVEYYAECLNEMKACYVLFSLMNSEREKLEDLRLAIKKEILAQERKLNSIHERLEVTRGDKLVDEAFREGCRHFRLVDQYEALSEALSASSV